MVEIILLVLLATAPADPVRQIGQAKDKKLIEASGLVASTQHAGILWTHNDGDDGVLYAIHADGAAAGRVEVREKFHDWEDIATDGEGNLYLADMGNNERNRKRVMVYRIAEPDPAKDDKVKTKHTYKLTFPDEEFDCESLFIRADHGYVISKVDGERAALYRFSLKSTSKSQVLERVCELPIDEPVTAASISGDGQKLAVLTRRELHVLAIGGKIESAATAKDERFSIPPVQAEGCCFSGDGVMVIAETGEIFSVALSPRDGE